MPSIGAALIDCLRPVERPGDFCVGGTREIVMPAIDVDGVGRIAFPVLPAQAERLVAVAEAAPYGRGEATIVDRDVRRTWQIDPGRIRIGGRHWPASLAALVADAALGLGVSEPVAAGFYKLLVYDAGSFFVDHRDTEKVPGMFATLAIVLPSAHSGGALIVRHLGREMVLDPHPEEPSEIGFAAFYADCVHEVRPVTAGCRITLVYNLRFLGGNQPPAAPDYRAEQRRAAQMLRHWAEMAGEPDKLVLPLEHAYTPAELSFATLKGRDAAIASVLTEAASDADCELHLALVSIEEEGSAEYAGYHGRRGHWRGDDDEEDADQWEMGEVFDRELTLSHWQRSDGGATGLGELPFDEDELCPPDAFVELDPDEQHFHEATGNAGASLERSYRHAGLVLWPRARRLAVLNQAGLPTTLPYLEELTAGWEANGAAIGSPLWQEADALSGHMLRTWPRGSWRPEGDGDPARMLDLQVRLGNLARIDAFLTELSAESHYAASDNAAIVRAAALLPRARATELLVLIVRRNAPAALGACGELVRRAAAPGVATGDPASIAAALFDLLPGDPAKPAAPLDFHQRPAPVTRGFVVDLLTATSRIDAGLAARTLDHLLAWPKTYRPDGVLVGAALVLAGQAESAAWPAARRLREVCLDHLRRRIAQPLEPPRDWARPNRLTCRCTDCRTLATFLNDPGQRQWLLKAAEERRVHVEKNARRAGCDLDLATERHGKPHTLVAVKNQASYDRRVKQRRQDLQHVSALGG
jgi:hypothetical protein